MFSMCLLYVSLWSRVSPNIFGLIFMGSVVLSICSASCLLYPAGSGMKRVHVVLSGLRMRLRVCIHVCISCRYESMFGFAMFISLYGDVVTFTGACGVGVSGVYMLNSVGDRTTPCGTPVLNWMCVNILFLNVVYALRPLMFFAMNLRMVVGCLFGVMYV